MTFIVCDPIKPLSFDSGATTSGLVFAPAYSPTFASVGPETIPPEAQPKAPFINEPKPPFTIALVPPVNIDKIPNMTALAAS